MSGSPAFDGLFVSIWLALASIQLFFFGMQMTIMSLQENAFIGALVFAGLVVLFTSVMAYLLGAFDHAQG